MADTAEPTAPKKPRKAPVRKAASAADGAAPKAKRPYVRKSKVATTPAPKATDALRDTLSKASASASAAAASASAKISETIESVDWKAQAEQIKDQASKAARTAATTAKDTTGAAMQNLSRLISDTADAVDTRLGPQYGDYARNAAQAVAGAAKSLDATDIDTLLDEARAFVRKSPAVAIGAAAIAGFVLMRLAKGSGNSNEEA